MMKLKNIDVYPWLYGEFNAQIYLSCILHFNSNLELLLAGDDGKFFNKLNLHEFLFNVDNLPTMNDKFLRFENLELSNWSMEQTFASAVCFLIQQQISKENFEIHVWSEVKNYMKFFCNDRYSDLLIEIYVFFNIPTLYPGACIDGCETFFRGADWNAEIQSYLNHTGLKNLLSLLKIDLNDLKEVINICNFVESTVPFVLFLKKYKEKNYENFSYLND